MIRLMLLTAVLLAPGVARAGSCFDGQLPPSVWAVTAAAAAVRLQAVAADGQVYAGASGMVVANSGRAGHGNRIITAGHFAGTLRGHPDAWLAVYSSRGRFLGRAAVVARAAPGPAFGLLNNGGQGDAQGLRFGDAAVLEMVAPAADGGYATIAGLPLAAVQPRGLLEGDFATPAGVEHGASGAGVVADGAIVGIVVYKALDPQVRPVPVAVGDAAQTGATPHRTIRLPPHAIGYAQPVSDAGVLAALGAAGHAVTPRRGTGTLRVFVPGFVQSGCVGYRASLHPA